MYENKKKVCTNCRHFPKDDHCIGCRANENGDGNTKFEPKDYREPHEVIFDGVMKFLLENK